MSSNNVQQSPPQTKQKPSTSTTDRVVDSKFNFSLLKIKIKLLLRKRKKKKEKKIPPSLDPFSI